MQHRRESYEFDGDSLEDEDLDAVLVVAPTAEKKGQPTAGHKSTSRQETDSYSGRPPRMLVALIECDHKVCKGDVFDGKWTADLACREEATKEDKLIDTGGKHCSGKTLANNKTMLGFKCKERTCMYIRRVAWSKKMDRWQCVEAADHSCGDCTYETGRGKSPHNYNATHFVELVRPILQANKEEKNGNTRNKKRLIDLSTATVRALVQPYVRADVTSEAAENIKLRTIELIIGNETKNMVRSMFDVTSCEIV